VLGWWLGLVLLLALVAALIAQATLGGAVAGWLAFGLGFFALLVASGLFRPVLYRVTKRDARRRVDPAPEVQHD
jgi:sulfite exporter TauE/SafE